MLCDQLWITPTYSKSICWMSIDSEITVPLLHRSKGLYALPADTWRIEHGEFGSCVAAPERPILLDMLFCRD